MPIFQHEELYNASNVPLIRPLLYEFNSDALLSIADNPPKDKVSMKKLYLKYCVADPTEVDFAEEVFGDLSFWLNMRDSAHVKPKVREWRELCDIIRKRDAFKTIIAEAKGDSRSSTAAARYIIEEPWKDKRRFKKQVERTATEAFMTKDIQEDLERITRN